MMPLLGSSAAETITPSSPAIMLLFAAVMMATYVGVAIERFHKTVAALCGACVLVALGLALDVFEYEKIYEFLEEDLNIFGVIIGTGILVDVTGSSGLFHFLSMLIVRATGGRATLLFLAICGLQRIQCITPAFKLCIAAFKIVMKSCRYIFE